MAARPKVEAEKWRTRGWAGEPRGAKLARSLIAFALAAALAAAPALVEAQDNPAAPAAATTNASAGEQPTAAQAFTAPSSKSCSPRSLSIPTPCSRSSCPPAPIRCRSSRRSAGSTRTKPSSPTTITPGSTTRIGIRGEGARALSGRHQDDERGPRLDDGPGRRRSESAPGRRRRHPGASRQGATERRSQDDRPTDGRDHPAAVTTASGGNR